MKASYIPLEDLEDPPPSDLKRKFSISHKLAVLFLVLYIASLSLNLAAAYLWVYSSGPRNPLFPQALYSPAQDVLEYQTVKFHSGFGTHAPIWDQPPSDDVDQAWHNLYAFAFSKISHAEAQHLPNKTYPILGDEPKSYMLALDVFHQLHCLDEVRKAMNPDRYPHTEEGINTKHMRHCLSSLRQSIMCSADISPIVWQWSDRSHAAKERSDIVHTCRNFEKIHEWSRQNFAGQMQNMSIYIPDDL